MSSSRSSAAKSQGRKQKRLQRFLEYNKAKALAAGETFEIVNMEERRSQQRAAMLVLPEDVSVDNPEEAISDLLEEHAANQLS
ncbi:MAG: hypothetical protein ACKPKO_18555, partial [Candidatus Fonsibacter sp.]